MFGWLGDLGRLSWGLLYWNWRKSLFRVRGAAGRAPCQHPSDSGRAGETACEACANWKSKERFRLLCPLLAPDSGSRRLCSANAADVRPFWGRAVLLYGGFAGGTLLVLMLSAFGVLRAVGYRVSLGVVAWPPAWHRIQEARADYFFGLAQRSLAARATSAMTYLALNQVYALDPDNARAALLLAQFSQLGNPDFSDEIYGRLPEAAPRRHRGDGRVLVSRHALAGATCPRLQASRRGWLRSGTTQGPAWAQALTFAEAMDGRRRRRGQAPSRPQARCRRRTAPSWKWRRRPAPEPRTSAGGWSRFSWGARQRLLRSGSRSTS